VNRATDPGEPPELEPLRVDTGKVMAAGMALWCLALLVTLVVPSLREGARGWWPWACVAALVGGALAWAYVRRGRGNASGA